MNKKRLIGLGLAISLAAVLFFSQNTLAQPPNYNDEITQVSADIRLLNLINGLELDEAQTEFIIQKAEEAAALQVNLVSGVNNGDPEIVQALQNLHQLRTTLLNGENIPQDLKGSVHQASKLTKELRLEYLNQRSQLAAEIKQILEPHQLYCLENYKPCLIPPKEGAAGQENRLEAEQRQLTRIRQIPERAFEKNKTRIVEAMFARTKMYLPHGYIMDEEAEKEWLMSLFEEARSMSDVDFSIEKAGLAERLQSRHALPKPPIDITVKIEKFLLNPDIIPLLKGKQSADPSV
ncbi:hypothetical protein ACFLW8_00645 [Chloroflexota bacterium]